MFGNALRSFGTASPSMRSLIFYFNGTKYRVRTTQQTLFYKHRYKHCGHNLSTTPVWDRIHKLVHCSCSNYHVFWSKIHVFLLKHRLKQHLSLNLKIKGWELERLNEKLPVLRERKACIWWNIYSAKVMIVQLSFWSDKKGSACYLAAESAVANLIWIANIVWFMFFNQFEPMCFFLLPGEQQRNNILFLKNNIIRISKIKNKLRKIGTSEFMVQKVK